MMTIKYQNPIIRGMHPDPSIVRVNDTYYLANSTFEYYPGITVMKSTDLLNWQTLGGVATLPSQADLRHSKSNEGIFAANIRYHDGYFYVITTNFAEFKTFIIRGKLSPDQQEISWEPSRVEVDVPGIDPDLYFEKDRTYVQFTGYIDDQGTKAIRQVEIDLTNGKILHQPEILTYGTGGRDVEGPHIFQKDGWYYLLTAEGGTGQGHMITIFRSKKLWGPYDDVPGVNPIFTNRDRAEEPLQNIGHGDFFTDAQGNWWLVCLGTRPAAVGFKQITNLGRETLLYPVTWKDGWPVVYHSVPTQDVDLTDFPQHAKVLVNSQFRQKFIDDFTKPTLRPEWLSLRDSLGDHQQIKAGQLVLRGNDQRVSDLSTPAFLGLRQTEQEERLLVTVDLQKSQFNEGAFGLMALIDAENHCGIMAEMKNDQVAIYRDQQLGDIKLHEQVGQLKESPAEFELVNTKDHKYFIVRDQGGEEVSFTTDAIHLSNEAIAALNTGDIEGLYAYGNAVMVVNQVIRSHQDEFGKINKTK